MLSDFSQEECTMPVTTIGELLDAVADFELRAETFYSDLRDHSGDNNVRLLAYYLSRQRRRLLGLMKDCEPDIAETIRNTIPTEAIAFSPHDDFFVIQTPVTEVEGKDLLVAAQNYSATLLKLYDLILALTSEEQAQDIFTSLIKTEKQDVTMMKKMQAMHYF
jgi:hypothetical protein